MRFGIGIVLALAAYAFWSAFRPVQLAAIDQPIRHDDFLFSVRHVTRKAATGGKVLYTVDVVVENQAVRVPYRWDDSIVYVTDAREHRYAPLTAAAFTIDPGQSGYSAVQFELPQGAAAPTLRFWDGILMGDVLDGAAYVRTGVPL